MLLRFVRRDLDGNHKVSGVASGGESATPVTSLVDRGGVGGTVWNLILLAWLHPNLEYNMSVMNKVQVGM